MIKNTILILGIILSLTLPCKSQVKIMPLGNSITAGQFKAETPPDNNSYRKDLLYLLRQNGYQTIFVGSNSCGDIDQKNNEGHSGWKISELQNGRNGIGGVDVWIPAYDPDIILLEIGTNDFNSKLPDLEAAVKDIDNLIVAIFKNKANVKLVVASLIPIFWNNNYFSYNTELFDVVKKHKSNGQNIWFYDMYNCGIGIDGFRDRLHPNAENGYVKMANAWYGVCKYLIDSVTICSKVTNPMVSTFSDRAILRWHPSFGAEKFNVHSASDRYGPYFFAGKDISDNWYVDTVSSVDSRFYIIEGFNSSNRIIYSDTISSTVTAGWNIQIDCGNASSGSFIEDVLYSGGNQFWFYYSKVSKSNDLSTIPDDLFKTARGGNSSYCFSNLLLNTSYKLILYFMEGYKTGSGQRTFDVAVNHRNILNDFDVYQDSGGKDIAIKKEFLLLPHNGNMVIEFRSKTDSAIINGIGLEPQLTL